MVKDLKPEQIEIINRIVFEQIEKMQASVAKIVQHLIDQVHGGNMVLAQKMISMEAKRLNISVHVEAE